MCDRIYWIISFSGTEEQWIYSDGAERCKDEDELTCVGTFPVITQGASIEAEGSFIQHPVYGKQFQAVRLTEKMPGRCHGYGTLSGFRRY